MKSLSVIVVLASVAPAAAQGFDCEPVPTPVVSGQPQRSVKIKVTKPGGAKLVARIEDPPRTRVTLSIDNDKGNHYELVWDPAVNDGLQHEVLLPHDEWTLTPSSEYERVQAQGFQSQGTVFTFGTVFELDTQKAIANKVVVFEGKNTVLMTPPPTVDSKPQELQGRPKLHASCRPAQSKLSDVHLDKRRITAVATARGLLDATVPEPIEQALSLLAEIALDRARSGAMELIKEKFVTPICDQLTLELFRIGKSSKPLLPRTCTLALQLRLQDVLGSGRALLDALDRDIRDTILPELITHLPLNKQTQTLARIALEFATRVIDGRIDGVVEIDYLVALLDQMSWATGFDQAPQLIEAWIKASALLQDVGELQRYVLELALPENFDLPETIKNQPWGNLPECYPTNVSTTVSGAIGYIPANRASCIAAIVATLKNEADWIATGIARNLFTLEQAVTALRTRAKLGKTFDAWLQAKIGEDVKRAVDAALKKAPMDPASPTFAAHVEKLRKEVMRPVIQTAFDALPTQAQNVVEAACGARLVVGIAKWCSSRESCAAGEIAAVLREPSKVFAANDDYPWVMCWKNDKDYRLPQELDRYIDIGARLVAFLQPPKKGEERERIRAMIHWMFDVVEQLDGAETSLLPRVHDVIDDLIDRDYINALTASIEVAASVRCPPKASRCPIPPVGTKALQLLGAIASYAHTYERTKDLDPAAARQARRQALETLIDAATERRARGGDVVWSLGSNVGISLTYTDIYDRRSPGDPREIAVRLPLGVALQRLPWGHDRERDKRVKGRYVGVHAGVQLADLGQFARDTANDVTWATFVSPGVELGLLLGEPHRTLTISAHISYAPALADDQPPVWRYGLAVGYYVPFFDFN